MLQGNNKTTGKTGARDRDQALLKVALWLETGVPTGRLGKPRTVEAIVGIDTILKAIRKTDLNGDDALRIVNILKDRQLIDVSVVKAGKGTVALFEFLEKFWDYTSSPYIREKLAHRQSIGKRHCYESMNRVRLYWEPYFKPRTINTITRQDLKEFSLSLADKGLSPSSINKIMICGTTALSWAFREGLIPVDPTAGLTRFSGEGKKRGVLTPQEAAEIFAIKWEDKRSYVGNLLSITTGLRSGEVLAIRKSDIGDKVLYIRHNWSCLDGLKSPKNGEARKVPLLPEVKTALLDLLNDNPHQGEDPNVLQFKKGA